MELHHGTYFVFHQQASEALADLLCRLSSPGRGYSYHNTAGRAQSGVVGYLGGGGGNAATAAAARARELHAQQLMFLLDM